MTRKAAFAGAASVLILVGIVLAQPLTGEDRVPAPIINGNASTHTTAQRLVITNATDYANFFGGSPPATPTVNFATEDVLAVTMGSQPSGSSISITGLDIRTTGFTAGWGFVRVSTVSNPITFTGGALTNTGGTTQNTGGTASVVGGKVTPGTAIVNGVGTTQFEIAGGATTITGGTTTTIGGTTSASTSLGSLTNTGGTTASTGATTTTTSLVTIIGGSVTATNPLTIFNGTTVTSGITTTGGTTAISGGITTGLGGSLQPYVVVKVSKGALTYAFLDDATLTPYSGATPLSSLNYTTGGGAAPFLESITIDFKGNVSVNRRFGATGGTIYVGALTPVESMALNTAFVNANPAGLPPTIADATPTGLTDLPSEVLTTAVGSARYTTAIERAGFYGGASTLKSLVDAIRAPAERVVRSTPTRPYYGNVHYVGTALRVARSPIDPADPFYDLIAGAEGRNVGFGGVPQPTATAVIDVEGTLNSDQPLLAFPSAGADVVETLPAGTPIDVTNLTLAGSYYEVTLGRGRSGVRGFLLASAVRIGH